MSVFNERISAAPLLGDGDVAPPDLLKDPPTSGQAQVGTFTTLNIKATQASAPSGPLGPSPLPALTNLSVLSIIVYCPPCLKQQHTHHSPV